MKKFVISILSVLCLFSIISCGSKPKNEEDPDETPIEAPAVDENTGVITEIDNTLALATVDSARQTAIKSGADTKAADQLKVIDAMYEAMKAKAEEGLDVSKESQDIANRYLALSAYISAKEAKAKVDETEKVSLVQKLYDEGCTALADFETMFEDPEVSGSKLLEKANKASTCFNSVLLAIYRQVARDKRDNALNSQKNANSVKAQVAMKDKYNEAVALFRKGDALYSAQDPAKAYDYYKDADELFAKIFEEVSEKRAAALKAIEDAKNAVADSASYAEKADDEAPITGPVEGIEEEGAVLLEEDNYEDPAAAEVELSAEVEDPLKEAVENAVESAKEAAEKLNTVESQK